MRYLLIIFTLFLYCCEKEQNTRSIEVISYKWIFRAEEDPKFHYSIYAWIENSGRCKIVINGKDKKTSCINTKIDKSIINRLFLEVDTLKHDINISPFSWPSTERPSLYDGPFIKMIVHNGRTVNIKFSDCEYDTSTNTSYKIYKILLSKVSEGEISDDTSEIFENRDLLIENLKANNDFLIPAPKLEKLEVVYSK